MEIIKEHNFCGYLAPISTFSPHLGVVSFGELDVVLASGDPALEATFKSDALDGLVALRVDVVLQPRRGAGTTAVGGAFPRLLGAAGDTLGQGTYCSRRWPGTRPPHAEDCRWPRASGRASALEG